MSKNRKRQDASGGLRMFAVDLWVIEGRDYGRCEVSLRPVDIGLMDRRAFVCAIPAHSSSLPFWPPRGMRIRQHDRRLDVVILRNHGDRSGLDLSLPVEQAACAHAAIHGRMQSATIQNRA
jgi:hypothetical protein